MSNIALITPLKDEYDSIERLINSIQSQTLQIHTWIIVENDSTDGSKEKLDEVKKINNVLFFKVINLSFKNKAYQLGFKYSTIVNYGFKCLVENNAKYAELDYIGILDSDCFPEKQYFEKLISFMSADESIGISSGRLVFEDGALHKVNQNHVRGSGRLWNKKCFDDAGYIIGMSADSLSTAKAILKGWKVSVCNNAFITSRIAGARKGFSYYGKSAYYRGNTLFYALAKTLKYLFKLRFKYALSFFWGYFSFYVRKVNRVDDKQVLNYFKNKKILKY